MNIHRKLTLKVYYKKLLVLFGLSVLGILIFFPERVGKTWVRKENSFLGITNTRKFHKGAFTAIARTPKEVFTIFLIGVPQKPYQGNQRIFLTLPDGSTLDISDPKTVEIIKKKSQMETSPSKVFNYADRKFYEWKEGAREIQIFPYFFIIDRQNLLGVRCYYNSSKRPYEVAAIGTKADNMYTIPLKYNDLTDIFGEPDKIVDSFRQ
jgi:hypothetical protein